MSMITDLNGYLSAADINSTTAVKHSTNKKAGADMDMTDYLKLMVATFQNQSIDDVASTSDMMNQMVQMTVVQALTNLNTLVTETNSLNYAASMVGKQVTIGQRDGNDYVEITGTVTGTGILDGDQVIFLGNDVYKISDVIAIGTLPAQRAGSSLTGTTKIEDGDDGETVRALADYLGIQENEAKRITNMWNKSAKGQSLTATETETLYLYRDRIETFLSSQAAKQKAETEKLDAVTQLAVNLGLSVPKASELMDLLDRYSSGESLTMEEMDELQLYGLIKGHSAPEDEDFSWLTDEFGVPESMVEMVASMLKYVQSGGSMTEEIENTLVGYGLIEPTDHRVYPSDESSEQYKAYDPLETVGGTEQTQTDSNTENSEMSEVSESGAESANSPQEPADDVTDQEMQENAAENGATE